MRTLAFSLLVSAGLAAGSNVATAAPANGLALNDAAKQASTLTLVRDGCGRGRHFSRWRGVCVWNGSDYPAYGGYYAPRAYGYYGYAPGYYYAPPVVYGSPYGYYGYRRYYW
jgi:hypothetical protein